MSDASLTGKTVLITGGAKRVGAEVARGLHAAGANLAIHYRNSSRDAEALAAFEVVAKSEGILPALETAHAFAQAQKIAPTLSKDQIIVINCSGRGDKDCQEVARLIGGPK